MLTVPFVLLVLGLFVTLASIGWHLAVLPLLRLLGPISPSLRSHLVLLVAAAPWLFGGGVLVSSIADIWFGACDFGDQCLWNEDPAQVSPLRALVVLPLLLGLVWLGLRALRQTLAARRVLATLDATSLPGDEPDLRIVPTDAALALAGGDRVYVSRALKELLPAEQLRAVLLHERAHVERRDGLFQLIALVLTAAYLPPIRRRLLAALLLANEQACDARAAAIVGQGTIAAAILAVERLRGGAACAALPGFADDHTAERVRRLVDPPVADGHVGWLRGITLLMILFAFLGADILYYVGMLILYPAT